MGARRHTEGELDDPAQQSLDAGPRKVALALSGLLVLAMAVVSGTALASSAAPASGMAGMTSMDQLTSAWNSHAQTGFTNAGTEDLALPPHSHVVATDNGNQSEWWNVDVVGVKSLTAWDKIVQAKSDWELEHLQRTDSADVTGNITTSLLLYFAVVR
jgi:hypothetical protein